MKIQAIKQNLIEGLSNVMRALSNKNTNPIFSSIYLKAENDKLYLTATDNEIRIETYIPVSVLEEGETVIPGKAFYDLVRRLPDVTIKINSESYEGKDTITILYSDAKTVMKGFPGRDFPGRAEIVADKTLVFLAKDFHQMIKHTSFTVSQDALREVYRGLLFDLNGHELSIVGTDSYRLTLMKLKVDNLLESNLEVIIPIRALNEVDKLIKEEDEKVDLTLTNRQAIFETEQSKLIVQLIKGEYPPYKRVVPENYQSFFSVDRALLLDTLERASLFSYEKDGTSVVKWQLGGGILSIHTESDFGKVDENIIVYQEGEDLEITFNARFLLDALKNISYEALNLTLNGSLGPCVIRPKDDDSYLYLILPLRR